MKCLVPKVIITKKNFSWIFFIRIVLPLNLCMGKPVSAPSQKCSIMIIVCIVPIYLLKSSQKYCIVENVTFPYVPQEENAQKGNIVP